jgi:hypothetical protein
MTIIYNSGLDLMRNWTSDPYGFALVTDAYVPDKDEVYLYEATTAFEIVTLGLNYVRGEVTNPARNIDNFLDRIAYDCDDITFGDPTAAQSIGYMILYKGLGDDFSELIAAIDLPRITDGDVLVVTLNAAGLLVTSQAD